MEVTMHKIKQNHSSQLSQHNLIASLFDQLSLANKNLVDLINEEKRLQIKLKYQLEAQKIGRDSTESEFSLSQEPKKMIAQFEKRNKKMAGKTPRVAPIEQIKNAYREALNEFLKANVEKTPEKVPMLYDIKFGRLLLPYLAKQMPEWQNFDPKEFGGRWNNSDESRKIYYVHQKFRQFWQEFRDQVSQDGKSHQQWLRDVIKREKTLKNPEDEPLEDSDTELDEKQEQEKSDIESTSDLDKISTDEPKKRVTFIESTEDQFSLK